MWQLSWRWSCQIIYEAHIFNCILKYQKTLKKFGLISHLLTLRASVFTSPDEAFVGNLSTGRLLLIIIFDWIRFYYFVKTHFRWKDSMTFFLKHCTSYGLTRQFDTGGQKLYPANFHNGNFCLFLFDKVNALKDNRFAVYFHHPPLFYMFVQYYNVFRVVCFVSFRYSHLWTYSYMEPPTGDHFSIVMIVVL